MNVIVLTSAMIDDDFNQYAKIAKVKPNPSNQNFYSKLIKALSYYNHVSVLSLRPFVKGSLMDEYLETKVAVEGTVHYYYPYIKDGLTFKLFKKQSVILESIRQLIEDQHYEEFVVVVDTLRFSLLKVATKLKKLYKCKVVGVLTDNPANLSGVKNSYIRAIKSNSNNFDGYIALTEQLNKIFNPKKKPYYLMGGLVEDVEPMKGLLIQDYLFFGGALYERYGVKRLVDGFHRSSSHYKLVIAGHGDLTHYIENMARKDNRILFIGQLPKREMYRLEQNAHFNINPRPYSFKLDKESVPSKLLEYFASGTPTITTLHTTLKFEFPEEAIWLNEDTEAGFEKAIDQLDRHDYQELKKYASTARLKVFELYGLKNQGEGITMFFNEYMKNEG